MDTSERSIKTARATLEDVCRRSGVSPATVSRVLNNNPRVLPQTRDLVLRTVKHLGYVPNSAARSLAGRRSQVLGVVLPDIGVGFWAEMLRGLNKAASDMGYRLLTAFSNGADDERDLVTGLLSEGRIDAMVVMNMRLGEDLAEAVAPSGLPLILIDRPVVAPGVATVSIDNIGGARAAMAHLFGHGYRDIAIFSGDANTFDSQQRLIGCRLAAREAGETWNDAQVHAGAFTEASGRELMTQLLDGNDGRRPQAVFCLNDDLALGAIDVLKERGLRVPEDMAIVGFDDVAVSRRMGLTTVSVPIHEIGRIAAQTAIHAIQSEPFERHTVLPTALRVRQSCGCGVTKNA